jgi:hypothetical protein
MLSALIAFFRVDLTFNQKLSGYENPTENSKGKRQISDKTKHIMKLSHINVNIYDKTATSQQNGD